MNTLHRARIILAFVALGLFFFGVTVWPALPELKLVVRILWGDAPPVSTLHSFILRTIAALEDVNQRHPFLLYAHDWLAFAHVMLAILFAGAWRDPVRNKWIVQCGLIMCACVPVLAGFCIPLRGLPLQWFWIDAAFAPATALPLWIVLRDINRCEKQAAALRAALPPTSAAT